MFGPRPPSANRALRAILGVTIAVGVAIGCGGSKPAPRAPGAPDAPAASSGGSGAAVDPLAGWELIREEDGIKVHKKEVEGSDLLAFRGEGVIEAPVARVALVQMDLDHAPEWVHRMKTARQLEVLSDTRFVTYSHIGAPPFISDRDFVNQVDIEFAPPSRIVFRIHSTTHPKAPSSPGVRGELLHSSFELVEVEPGKTRLTCEIHADPKGALPKKAVNLFQRAWAFRTIQRMREQVKRTDLAERAPAIRALLVQKGFTIP